LAIAKSRETVLPLRLPRFGRLLTRQTRYNFGVRSVNQDVVYRIALSQPEVEAYVLPIDFAERRQRVAQHHCNRSIAGDGIDAYADERQLCGLLRNCREGADGEHGKSRILLIR